MGFRTLFPWYVQDKKTGKLKFVENGKVEKEVKWTLTKQEANKRNLVDKIISNFVKEIIMKITSIELRTDKNGDPLKYTTFENGDVVYVNSKYDSAIYEQVIEGSEWEVIQDGNFKKIKYDKPVTARGGGNAGIAKAQETKRKDIETAQESKQTAIEISSTFRDATAITIAYYAGKPFTDIEFKNEWLKWRKWLVDNFDQGKTKRDLGF